MKPIFAKWISTLITGHMQHFPFPASREKGPLSGPQKWMTPRGVWPWGIQIGSFAVHETYFCKMDVHFINRPDAALPFSCIKRKGHSTVDPKSEWHQGVYDPGAFKLDHLQSMKPIFAKWISTLLTSHMQHFPFPACWGKNTCTVDPKGEWQKATYDPGAFKLGRLQSMKPIFAKYISTLLTSHMQHFPFPACSEKGSP